MSTIAAVSTPFGRGGIAVIRISGENALTVASKMFLAARGCDLCTLETGRAVYGRIMSEGKMIDDGIATVFRAPSSFTGEDTVEISCHGGILLTEKVLKTAFDCGAVPAKAGEFSQRAFLN
jgi:tRNA modification GTPase